MFHEIFIGFYLGLTLNNIETFAKPVDVPKPNLPVLPFQLVNVSDLLAYQGFDLNDNNLNETGRKKRFLDDLINLFSWLEDYENQSEENDDDEDDSSKEEESSGEKIGKQDHDICNCSVTINNINQLQHVYHDTHKVPSNESPIVNTNTNKDDSKSPIAEENIQSIIKQQEESFMATNEKPVEAHGSLNAAAPAKAKEESPAQASVPAKGPALPDIPAVAKAPAPLEAPAKVPALAEPLPEVPAEHPVPTQISTKASPPIKAPVTGPVPSEASAKAEILATGTTEAQAVEKALGDKNAEVQVARKPAEAGASVPAERPAIPEIPAVAQFPALAEPLATAEVPPKNTAPDEVPSEHQAPPQISAQASTPIEAPVTGPVPSEAPAKAEALATDNNAEIPVAPKTTEAGNIEAPEIPVEAPKTTEATKEGQME